MAPVPGDAESSRLPRAVLVAALAALALKLFLALATYGTNDLPAFWYFLQEYRGSGAYLLYEKDEHFNHPPFVIQWLVGLRALEKATGLRPRFLLRLPAILADLGSLLLLARLLRTGSSGSGTRLGLLLVAAAPVSVMVSGFHGNNDPVMVFLVLLSIFLLERCGPAWPAGLAMGMAVNMKIVPLAFWPAVFLWLPTPRRRLEYFGAAIATIVLASSPILFEAPGLLARKVLLYPSAYGLWGISRLLGSSDLLAPLSRVFESGGRILLVAALLVLSVWMNRGPRKPPLLGQIGLLSFAFLALTPGFGVQYLAWIVPFVCLLPAGVGLALTLASGAFLFLVYTFWCQDVAYELADPNWLGATFWEKGFPWSYANVISTGEWRGPIVPFEVACWLAVVAGFVWLLRTVAAERRAAESGPQAA